MSSTFTTSLKFNKPALGDAGWGTAVNGGFTDLADQALGGQASIDVGSGPGPFVLTIPDGAAGDARNMFIRATGNPGGAREIQVPTNRKLYFVTNDSDGAVTVKVLGQTGVVVPVGASMALRINPAGTDVGPALTYQASMTLGTALAAASGGTGQSSYAVGDLLYADTTTTLDKLASVAEGSVLRAKGVGTAPAWEQVDLTTDVTGVLPAANGGAERPGYPGGGFSIVPYGGMAPSAAVTVTLAGSTIYYIAFYIHSQIAVSAIKIHVSTAQAGSTIRLGLYGLVDGFPTTKLADFGTVSSATTGLKSIALSTTLNSGYYYIAVCSDTADVAVRSSSILPVIVSPITGILAGLLQMVTLRTETTTGNTLPTTAAASGYFGVTTGVADITANVSGVYFETV